MVGPGQHIDNTLLKQTNLLTEKVIYARIMKVGLAKKANVRQTSGLRDLYA